ncbi:MAG: UDP-2,3-diacylglucosamine diphosphatase, partial [Hyphomicrobiales bacterium]|nr:UDP-2,3-diacylglucosamine diphosphatase [Hyphomicrobiales bacterium]MBV8661634.1 UDP-2,3-diacylglucosamine diphosphatase [Hyphomicrobiales bacterium]
HHPTIREINGVTYVNTGDFVESCSLVVEHFDGRFEVLFWSKTFAERQRELATAPAVAASLPQSAPEVEAA